MLRPEDRSVGVVVEDDELRAPEEDDLGLGRQQRAEGAAEALRPGVKGAERRPRPVEAADPLAHLASAREEVVRARGRPFRRIGHRPGGSNRIIYHGPIPATPPHTPPPPPPPPPHPA